MASALRQRRSSNAMLQLLVCLSPSPRAPSVALVQLSAPLAPLYPTGGRSCPLNGAKSEGRREGLGEEGRDQTEQQLPRLRIHVACLLMSRAGSQLSFPQAHIDQGLRSVSDASLL